MDAVDRSTVTRVLRRVRNAHPGIVAGTGLLIGVRAETTTLWFIPRGFDVAPLMVATFGEAKEAAA